MDRIKYNELVNFLIGNIFQDWDKRKIKQLENESKSFEVKYGILYKKGNNEKSLRVLREDEIDTVIFMMHNHPTGGHFGKMRHIIRLVQDFGGKECIRILKIILKDVILVREEE